MLYILVVFALRLDGEPVIVNFSAPFTSEEACKEKIVEDSQIYESWQVALYQAECLPFPLGEPA